MNHGIMAMAEMPAVTSGSEEIHSFVKLAIAYLGIMAGFSKCGLTNAIRRNTVTCHEAWLITVLFNPQCFSHY